MNKIVFQIKMAVYGLIVVWGFPIISLLPAVITYYLYQEFWMALLTIIIFGIPLGLTWVLIANKHLLSGKIKCPECGSVGMLYQKNNKSYIRCGKCGIDRSTGWGWTSGG